MKNRINSYLRAVYDGRTEQYHDYRDMSMKRMSYKEYTEKWKDTIKKDKNLLWLWLR